jgi:hypothetical protein
VSPSGGGGTCACSVNGTELCVTDLPGEPVFDELGLLLKLTASLMA